MFLLLSPCLHARGGSEDGLARAEALIERKEYEQAINLLADVIRQDPELFDGAQLLVERVRKIQEAYNTLLAELPRVLYEQGDFPKTLEIIARLEALDPHPSRTTRDVVARAKAIAMGEVDRGRSDALMEQALARLRAGDLKGAIDIYLSAFAINRDEFYAAPLGAVNKDGVRAAVESVRATAVASLEIQAAAARDADAVASSVIRGGQNALNLLRAQIEGLSRIAAAADTAEKAAQVLARQRQALPRGSSDADYFLFASGRAIAGRTGRETEEGIRQVERLALARAAASIVPQLRQGADVARARATAGFQAGNWAAVRDELTRLEPLARATVEIVYLGEAYRTLEPGYDPGRTGGLLLPGELPAFLEVQHAYREDRAYTALAAAHLDAAAARTATGWEAARLAAPIGSVEALASDWSRYTSGLQAASQPLAARADVVLAAAAGALRDWRQGALQALDPVVAVVERQIGAEEQLLRDGETVTLDDGTSRVVRNPTVRLRQLTALRGRLAEAAAGLSAVTSGAADPAVFGASAPLVAPPLEALQALRARADGLLARAQAAVSDATARSVAASSHKSQGDTEYRTAQAAFGRGEYNRARDALGLAAEAYGRSLDIQEDAAVRDLRDRVLPALLAEVNKGENSLVVAEVRRLIDNAVASYRRTEFKRAEDLLVNAQARWRDANAESNAEVENWLGLVRRALSTQEGWDLVETQPLYRDIAQLLKFASDDFARGEALEAGRQPEQARLAFAAAQEKLDTINLAVPKLKTANFLRLKITQKLEPALFNQRLGEAKARARAAVATGAARALADSYSETTDFAQIVTNDRDLGALIERLEILLGRRAAPLDPARIAASRARYVDAQRIYDARQRDLYGQAVRLLDEAIALYPENRDAVLLKDRILIDTGGARQDIISSDDLKEFRLAERLYSESNYPAANAAVKRLLLKPANRNYPPLLDLRDKLARRGFE